MASIEESARPERRSRRRSKARTATEAAPIPRKMWVGSMSRCQAKSLIHRGRAMIPSRCEAKTAGMEGVPWA
jgi:hypothetical protein